jgi:hypothetical protein
MKVTVQVVLHSDDDTQTVVREAFTLNREALAPDSICWTGGRVATLDCIRPHGCNSFKRMVLV